MSNPAIEAAQRATAADGGFVTTHDIAAAREALRPVRAVYERLDDYSRGPGDYRAGVAEVLRALAPLIYTTEEMP